MKEYFLVLVFIVFSITCNTQININDLYSKRVVSDSTVVWQQVSCGNGGMSNTIRYHPTVPNHVTMLGDMWCSYQSTDNGTRWYNINDYDSDGSFQRQRDLVYSHNDPEFGISVCSSEMYSTQDTGKTWQPVKNCPWYEIDGEGLDRTSWISKVAGLGIDPNNKDVWFVGGGEFVRGDISFSCYKDPTRAEPHGQSALNEGKLWRTKNGGLSWDEVGGDLNPKAQVGPIMINPKNSQQVFAATTYGIYRSDNGGDNWINIGKGKLDNNIIMDLDYYYNEALDTLILYVIDQVQYVANGTSTKCTGGIFQSKDYGDTWENINGDLYLDISMLTGGVPDNYYKFIAQWFGISQSVAKSTYPNLPDSALQHFTQLTTDPSRMGALYLGLPSPQTAESILPGRLWTTSNNGQKWVNTARLYEHVWENDKTYWNERGNPWNENMTLGHESPHMQWGNGYAQRAVRGLDVGVDGSVMMLSDHTTSLSTDHGQTWHQVDEDFTPSGALVGRGNSDLPAHVIAQDKRIEHTFLGSGEHRLWLTTNDSPDERQAIKNIMSSTETISGIAFDPFDANIVYSTSSRQAHKQEVFKSTDAGETWSGYGIATPATTAWNDDFYTNALTIDPINNQFMYHGITRIADKVKANDGGFFRSIDGGKSFSQSNSGLPSPVRIKDIQFDPRDNTRASLFVAAQKYSFNYHSPLTEGGLYHSTNRGQTWSKINTPSSIEGVEHIRFDHTNRMYITTGYRGGGSGVWYTEDYGESWTQLLSYPRVQSIDISPFDNNLLVITTRYLSKNPGVYVSRDRGLTWVKSNINIAIPQHIEDIKFDVHNPDVLWLGTLGTGFYKGKIKEGNKVQVIKVSPGAIDSELNSEEQLSVSIVNSDFTGETISWKSENIAVATVDQNGLVTTVGLGNTKIWATTENGRFSDYCVFVVHQSLPNSILDVRKKDEKIQIIPIPVTDKFSINGVEEQCNVKIYDLNGNLLINTFKVKNIEVSELKEGIYIVKIESGGRTCVKKFTKI